MKRDPDTTPVVNCRNRKDRTCVAGHGGGRPSTGFCSELCTHRVEWRPGPAVRYVKIRIPNKPFDGSAIWTEWYGRVQVYAGDVAAERAWIKKTVQSLPCGSCRHHARRYLRDTPPDLSSRDAYFAWLAGFHNAVAKRIGKEEWAIERQRERWA